MAYLTDRIFFDRLRKIGFISLCLFLPFSITGMTWTFALLAMLWIWSIICNLDEGYWKRYFLIIPIIALIIWYMAATIMSSCPNIAFRKFPRIFILWCIPLTVFSIKDYKTLSQGFLVLAGSAGVVGLYGLGQHFLGDLMPRPLAVPVKLFQETGTYYAMGLFDHHLTFGFCMMMIWPVIAAMLLMPTFIKQRVWLIAANLAVGLSLAFSYARSAWIGLTGGLLIWAAMIGKKATGLILMILVGLLIFSSVISSSIRYRLSTIFSAPKNIERIITWKTSLEMVKDHPIFGIGPGCYHLYASDYRRDYNVRFTSSSHAHNTYIQVAVEAGIPALLTLLILVGGLFYCGKSARYAMKNENGNLVTGLIVSLTAFSIASLFQHSLGDSEVAFAMAVMAGCLVRLSRSLLKEENRN